MMMQRLDVIVEGVDLVAQVVAAHIQSEACVHHIFAVTAMCHCGCHHDIGLLMYLVYISFCGLAAANECGTIIHYLLQLILFRRPFAID